jgi:prepilin-type N-terminal cleavage/methylation domain-containing protein
MTHASAKGFTLIELAVVIAIIAILASVAIQRFSNLTAGAERAVAENFGTQLNTAAATFMAANARQPTGYTDFVTNDKTKINTGTFTIVTPVDRAGVALCTAPAAATITCNNFKGINASYAFSQGVTTATITNK